MRFRVSDDEHARIRAAVTAGRYPNTADYLRARALQGSPRPVPASCLVGGLGQISGRLAAISRSAEQRDLAAIVAEVKEAEAVLAGCLRHVMSEHGE